ncbi:DUF2314 domain-containing protein [bacterium]|nr:MAG: DUF2314 domain-containing protein [bacterium]
MFGFLKRIFAPEPTPDPVALVILQTTPRLLTRGHLSQALTRALGRPFAEDSIAEETPIRHRFTVEGYELTVLSAPSPYFPKDQPQTELRLNDAIERHQAAILIDCWTAPPERSREDGTDLMGQLAAELLDETSLAVYCFHTQRLNIVDENLVSMLREGRAMEAMSTATFDPVIGIGGEDERMNAAIEEARQRWPEFVHGFSNPSKGADEPFLIKARFEWGEHVEHMWVKPDKVSLEGFEGNLENDSLYNGRLRKGTIVSATVAEVSDWAFLQDGEMVGLFTESLAWGR